jgi:organic hydroperoxide reductase OsmC/OhrA
MISHVSQVATKKKLVIRNERVRVVGHFHEQGSVLSGTAKGFCDGFEVEVEIESDEPPEVIAKLVRLARQMCFTEQALAGNTAVKVTPRLNGQLLEG